MENECEDYDLCMINAMENPIIYFPPTRGNIWRAEVWGAIGHLIYLMFEIITTKTMFIKI